MDPLYWEKFEYWKKKKKLQNSTFYSSNCSIVPELKMHGSHNVVKKAKSQTEKNHTLVT